MLLLGAAAKDFKRFSRGDIARPRHATPQTPVITESPGEVLWRCTPTPASGVFIFLGEDARESKMTLQPLAWGRRSYVYLFKQVSTLTRGAPNHSGA